MPCAGFHPKSPVMGRLGEDKDFDGNAFDAFQALLSRWGAEAYVTQKEAVWAAIRAGDGPETWAEPATRLSRTALRNAIRQWRRRHGETALVATWARTFDKQGNV